MTGVILIATVFLSVALTFVMNWLALIPWRRARDQHWTERARLYYPVGVAAMNALWVIPADLCLAIQLLWPEESPHWAFTALVASIGTAVGTLALDHEVFPRIPLRDLLRQSAIAWLIRFLMWFVFLTAIALMPEQFNVLSLLMAVAVVALCFLWSRDGWLRLGKMLGVYAPPTARLQTIVQDLARRMNVTVAETYLMRVSSAQALAFPGGRKLLFSERLLELLTDDELAAVCAHELGHLTETRFDHFKRHVIWLTFLPWIFFNPLVHALGPPGFYLLLGTTLLAPFLYRKISHPLEERAYRIAQSNQADSGIYAQALALLYEDNLAPAVTARTRETHPRLYDRLIAAGVTPDYPRPAPAQQMALHGTLLSGAMGMLAVILILRLATH